MPRKARIKSETGIYHVMMRGVNKQQIFFDEEDTRVFIRILEHYKAVYDCKIFAYCIMGNHVHFLVGTGDKPLANTFRDIGSTFARWYNMKYDRTGHLFQGRYRSEVVNTKLDFLRVLRYILQNPVKAGICALPQHYKYSSTKAYFTSRSGLTDTEFAFSLLDKALLQEFILENNNDACLDIDEAYRRGMIDSKANALIMKEFGTYRPLVGKASERQELYESIKRLYKAGISIRQLSRLTGIPKKIIERALR